MNIFPRYAIYGHHKCATMTLNTIANALCRRLGLRFFAIYDELPFNNDLPAYCEANKIDFLSYGNADHQFVKTLPMHRAFHIVRDPRDIAVSAYFSHLNSHSLEEWTALRAHRKKLQNLNKDDGMTEEIRFRGRSFTHMQSWDYSQDHITEIRFEDLASKSYETLLHVFSELGLIENADYSFWKRQAGSLREIAAKLSKFPNMPNLAKLGPRHLPATELLIIAWRHRFEAKTSGRDRGKEDVTNHYRKGSSGDWRDHFNDGHKKLFKTLYPGLVPTLGYDNSDSW